MQTFRSLQHRNYRLYFFGQMVSLIGSWMQNTALMWLAYEQTHQARWPAFLVAAQIGPTLLLGPFAGALADRMPRRALIFRTQISFLLIASTLGIFFLLDAIRVEILLGIMFAHGIIQAVDLPARLAFVSGLVPRKDLANAVALNSLLFNVARMIGPAIAGFLLEFYGPGPCFALNALSYIPILIALAAMKFAHETLGTENPESQKRHGWSVIRHQPQLVGLIALAGWIAICGWPLLALLPAYSERILHASKGAYSGLLSSVGGGALIAALTAATFGNEKRRGLLIFSGLILVSLALGGLSLLSTRVPAMLCCGLFGFGMILFFATGQAAVQLSVEDRDRGKVMGLWAMMLSAGTPIGNLVLGPTADFQGLEFVLAIQSICMASGGIILAVSWWRRAQKHKGVSMEVSKTH